MTILFTFKLVQISADCVLSIVILLTTLSFTSLIVNSRPSNSLGSTNLGLFLIASAISDCKSRANVS